MVRIGHLVISEPVCGFKAVLEATVASSSWFCRREKLTYAVRFWVRIKAPEGVDSSYVEFFETITCSTYEEADELLDQIESTLSQSVKRKVVCTCGLPGTDFGGSCDGPCGGPCEEKAADAESEADESDAEESVDEGADAEEADADSEADAEESDAKAKEGPGAAIGAGAEGPSSSASLPHVLSVDSADQSACCFSAM